MQLIQKKQSFFTLQMMFYVKTQRYADLLLMYDSLFQQDRFDALLHGVFLCLTQSLFL